MQNQTSLHILSIAIPLCDVCVKFHFWWVVFISNTNSAVLEIEKSVGTKTDWIFVHKTIKSVFKKFQYSILDRTCPLIRIACWVFKTFYIIYSSIFLIVSRLLTWQMTEWEILRQFANHYKKFRTTKRIFMQSF